MNTPLNSNKYTYVADTTLRHTYPYGRLDVELPPASSEQLKDDIAAVYRDVPECRRIVVAVEQGDIEGVRACEEAGMNYALDVQLRDGREVSLMVDEPDWVAGQSTDIEDLELS